MYPVIAPLSAANPQDNGIGSRLGCRKTRPEVAVHPAFGVRFPAEIALTIGHIVPFSVGTNRSVASVCDVIIVDTGYLTPVLEIAVPEPEFSSTPNLSKQQPPAANRRGTALPSPPAPQFLYPHGA